VLVTALTALATGIGTIVNHNKIDSVQTKQAENSQKIEAVKDKTKIIEDKADKIGGKIGAIPRENFRDMRPPVGAEAHDDK